MSDVKALWQNQTVEEKDMITLSDVRTRAATLQARVRMRNVIFYAYALFNIVASVWLIATGRLSAYLYPMLLMVAAHLFVLWQVNRWIGARALPGDAGGRPVLDTYRDELKRQVHGMSRAWLWYMVPFMPAFLWELAIFVQRIETGALQTPKAASYRLLLYIIFGAVFFWTAVLLAFSRAALRLQLQLEQLKRVEAE